MRIVVAGAHGQVARRLGRLLSARGDTVVGLVRNPGHRADLEDDGVEPVVLDLEQATVDEVAEVVRGADAVVFAAGAGPGSGAARKATMDRDGAIKLLNASASVGARRFLIVSSVGAENPPSRDDVFSAYLRAKAEADAAVRDSDREWTIVRPGRLTEEPGTGRVRIQSSPFRGEVPRDDVAAVLDALLEAPRAIGQILYVGRGDDPIEEALDSGEPAS
jgi:uncharacterized protein YbjT (DUF2867 family)